MNIKMTTEQLIQLDLELRPGLGATSSIGSDCYPWYVVEVLPGRVVGIYQPEARFDEKHPWEGGEQVVGEFDPSHKPDCYIKLRYGHWWETTKSGQPISRFRMSNISFGKAYAYQDPSF